MTEWLARYGNDDNLYCMCYVVYGEHHICFYHQEKERMLARAMTEAALERRIERETRFAEEMRLQEERILEEIRLQEERMKAEEDLRKFEENVRSAEEAAIGIFPSKAFHSDKDIGESISHRKGVVSAADVKEFSGSVISSRPEGYKKFWAHSIELVNVLKDEIRDADLTFKGKRVLQLSCSNGLPGIFACLKGASVVHFQDRNAENVRCITAPNVLAYLTEAQARQSRQPESPLPLTPSRQTLSPTINFYAGDFEELPGVLSTVKNDGYVVMPGISLSQDGGRAYERVNEADQGDCGYDIILMTRIPYSVDTLKLLYALIKKCLRLPHGVLYLASTKHRHGDFSSGLQRLRKLVDKEGIFEVHLVKNFADKDIWKFSHKVNKN